MNYGEQLAYWYLRFNGFFPITNLVMHRGELLDYTTDCDVLAVRPPHVFEEVGGRPEDWDDLFKPYIDGRSTLGIICQSKTGGYEHDKLFKADALLYAAGRLGLSTSPEAILDKVLNQSVVEVAPNVRLLKLLVTQEPCEDNGFLCITLPAIERFIRRRVEKYPKEKYRDRLFFQSDLMQFLIDKTYHT